MGGEKGEESCGFPKKYRFIVVFAVGYEDKAKRTWGNLEERIRNHLAEPRKRKPTSEDFFKMFQQRE